MFGLKLFGKFGIFFFFLLFVFSIVREYSSHRCLRTNESIDRSIDQDFSKRATNVFHGNREGGKENKGREEKRAHCKINKLRQFRESDRIPHSYCYRRIVANLRIFLLKVLQIILFKEIIDQIDEIEFRQ